MHKLAPALIQSREAVEVEYVVREAFGFLTNQPKVIIRVPEAVEPHLRDKTDLMASRVGYEGEVVLVGDPELDTTDCRISWFAGAVESSRADTWADIDAIVNRALSNDMPPADTTTDVPEHAVETPQPNDTEATSDLS
jgi:flagellar assembly protein FliH